MRNNYLIVVSNDDTKEYFISDKHDDYGLKGFIPVTHYLPSHVVPRKGFENGILKTPQDILNLFYDDYTDISNTDLVLDVLTRP